MAASPVYAARPTEFPPRAGTLTVRHHNRARERSEIERRRTIVARLRWLEANLTAAEIAEALQQAKPPILVSVRTVERDFIAIREQAHRYLSARGFDAKLEVGTALSRFEMLARVATKHALSEGRNGARWARIAIRATEAKAALLQDIGLLDRRIGTLFIAEDQPAERIPTGEELQKRFAEVEVTDGEVTSEVERAWLHGDPVAFDESVRQAK